MHGGNASIGTLPSKLNSLNSFLVSDSVSVFSFVSLLFKSF